MCSFYSLPRYPESIKMTQLIHSCVCCYISVPQDTAWAAVAIETCRLSNTSLVGIVSTKLWYVFAKRQLYPQTSVCRPSVLYRSLLYGGWEFGWRESTFVWLRYFLLLILLPVSMVGHWYMLAGIWQDRRM